MTLRLEDIELIKRLKHAYCRCIDTANIAELKTLFTEDASVLYIGGTYRFEAQGRDKIIDALENAFHSEAVAFHSVLHPEIDVLSDTEATGTWYLHDWFLDKRHKIATEGSALYKDKYLKRDGRWQIHYASYERVYEIVTPVTEMPNLTAHMLGKLGKKLPPL